MKKMFVRNSISTIALLVLGMLVSGIAFAIDPTMDICHVTGKGTYILISVSSNAVPAHFAHGDVLPGQIVDGQLVLGDCSLVGVQIVNSALLYYGPTGWGGWSCPTGTTVYACAVSEGATVAQKLLWVPGAYVDSVYYPSTPFGYTYTPPETGCIVQNDNDSETITITLTWVIN